MRNTLYILIIGLAMAGCAAQKRIAGGPRVYAYKQVTLQGLRPTVVVDEQGRTKEQVMKPQMNYLVYVEMMPAHAKLSSLSINGTTYFFKEETVTTPVVMRTSMDPNAPPDTLVRASTNKVVRITPTEAFVPFSISEPRSNMIASNELVLEYTLNGKVYSQPLKAIKNLPPVALQ